MDNCTNFFSKSSQFFSYWVCFRSCSIDFWQQECERALFKMTELYSAEARNLSPLHRHNLASECRFSICLFLNLNVVFGVHSFKYRLFVSKLNALDEFFCRQGIEFTPCNGATVGHCACTQGDPKVRTYSFDMDGQQRCFTVDHPRLELKPFCYNVNR